MEELRTGGCFRSFLAQSLTHQPLNNGRVEMQGLGLGL